MKHWNSKKMATSEVSYNNEDNDITTCTICLEQFNIPKYLPCLHSFCESCIGIYITSAFEKENTCINCPVCRSKVSAPETSITPEQWAKSLPLNFLLVGLIEKHKVERPEKICMSCERIDVNKKSEAISVCIDCSDTLCSNCLNCHRINKSSSNHEIVDISRQGIVLKSFKNMCTEHKGKEIELFCADHDLPCCATCVSVKHRKCENILVIDDAAKKFRETTSVDKIKTDVTTLLAEMEINLQSERKSLDKVQERAVSQLNTYNEFWMHLEQTIDKIRRNQTKQYQVQFDTEKSKIQASIDSIENKQKTVTNSRQILEVAEREASDVQVMIEVQKIKRQIEQCKFELQRKGDIFEIEFQFTKNVDEVDSIFEKICILNCNRLNTVNVSSLKSKEQIVRFRSSELEINSELDQEREYNCPEMVKDWPDNPVEEEVGSDGPVQANVWQDAQVESDVWSDEPVPVNGWPDTAVECEVGSDEPVNVNNWQYEPVECIQGYIESPQLMKVHRPKTRQQEIEKTRTPYKGSESLSKRNMQQERVRECQMEEVPTVDYKEHPEPVEWKPSVSANQSGQVHVTRPLSVATGQQGKGIPRKLENACEWQQQMKPTFQPERERHWQRNTIPYHHLLPTEIMEVNSVDVDDKLSERAEKGPQECIPDYENGSYEEKRIGRKELNAKTGKKSKKRR